MNTPLLVTYLAEQVAKNPGKIAVVETAGYGAGGKADYARLSYQELDSRSSRLAEGLYSCGIRKGMKTVLMVKPSIDLFLLTFALMKVGAVIVMIDPGMGLKNLGKCLAEVGPEAFIGESKAHVARILFRWASSSLRVLITRGTRWFWGGYNLAYVPDEPVTVKAGEFSVDPADLCAVMFTSGSTGIAKGVEFTNAILSAQIEIMREVYQYGPDETSLATFPLFALMDVAIGLTVVIPDMDATRPAAADPRKLIAAMLDNNVTTMFGSPALLDNLSRHAEKASHTFSGLRRVLTAGAPVRPDILRRLQARLPEGAQIFTPYGATEALPICNIGSAEILRETSAETEKGAGTCIGRPNPCIAVEIIGISDEPIAEWSDALRAADGQIGEIVVTGPVVTRQYHGRPIETGLAKIKKPDGTIMHRMGDLARRDAQGRIWFCGRKSHRVVTVPGGKTYFSVPCESVFNTHPKVFRTALVGIGLKGSQKPAVCVELEPDHRTGDRTSIVNDLKVLAERFPHTQGISDFRFHPGFPVDIRHNAKIGREELSTWATESTDEG
jgi:acyl-CoA synthetase (AMP-forming)/AMP-acid ligase II